MATSHRSSGRGSGRAGVPLHVCAPWRKRFSFGAGQAAVFRPPDMADQASRALSTARLKASLPLHLPPINVVVSHGPSGELNSRGGFIFGGASHLDAFSGYPFPT